MRKDLQKRVLVVAAALERLAGPQEMAEILSKISKLSGAIAAGKFAADPQKNAKANAILMQLYRMHSQMAAPKQEDTLGGGLGGDTATAL